MYMMILQKIARLPTVSACGLTQWTTALTVTDAVKQDVQTLSAPEKKLFHYIQVLIYDFLN